MHIVLDSVSSCLVEKYSLLMHFEIGGIGRAIEQRLLSLLVAESSYYAVNSLIILCLCCLEDQTWVPRLSKNFMKNLNAHIISSLAHYQLTRVGKFVRAFSIKLS
jgi:hypothetical protein